MKIDPNEYEPVDVAPTGRAGLKLAIRLTPVETDALSALAERRGQLVTALARELLLHAVEAETAAEARTR